MEVGGGATMIDAITSGATAVTSAVVSTVSSVVASETFITLIGLAIGYGVVKFVINMLPMIRSRR